MKVLTVIMSMPETTVDKYAGSIFSQHQVWMSWQSWIVQPVSKTMAPQIFAHKNFRLRVFRSNRSHCIVPLLWCHFIHYALQNY